jgi:hypothetical protein
MKSRHFLRTAFLAVLGLAAVLFTGCKTDDELSGRPWNTPKSWEIGLPASMTEGR